MLMIMEMLQHIRAVRTGDWKIHLAIATVVHKVRFCSCCLNYATLIPLYLAEMQMLQVTDPEMYE